MLPSAPVAGRSSAVDGLRGVAVGLVVVAHALAALTHDHTSAWLAPLADGGRGVLVFFVLSGYLITSTLLREQDETGRIRLRAFYARRALRILPAYYVFLAVVGALALAGAVDVTGAQWSAAATFTWNYSSGYAQRWLGHTWSLAVEEQFYLLWPLALVLLRRRTVVAVALGACVVLPVVRVAEYVLDPSHREQLPIMFHTRADSLLCGALLALAVQHPVWRERVTRLSGRLLLPAGVFLGLVAPYLWAAAGGAFLLPVGYTLENLAAVVLVSAAVAADRRAVAVLAVPALVALGVLSYSLYLWQELFVLDLNTTPTGLPLVNIAVSLLVAWVSYRFVERPFLRLKRRFERARPALVVG